MIKEKIKVRFISEKKNLNISILHQLNIIIMKKKLKKIIVHMIVKNSYYIRIKYMAIELQMMLVVMIWIQMIPIQKVRKGHFLFQKF